MRNMGGGLGRCERGGRGRDDGMSGWERNWLRGANVVGQKGKCGCFWVERWTGGGTDYLKLEN